MSYPCVCNRIPPPGTPYDTRWCRLCWLRHNDERYRRKWEGENVTPPEGNPLSLLVAFAKAWLAHARDAFRKMPSEVKEERLRICGACPAAKLSGGVCTECGCLVELKAEMASEACPLGFWNKQGKEGGKCGGCPKSATAPIAPPAISRPPNTGTLAGPPAPGPIA